MVYREIYFYQKVNPLQSLQESSRQLRTIFFFFLFMLRHPRDTLRLTRDLLGVQRFCFFISLSLLLLFLLVLHFFIFTFLEYLGSMTYIVESSFIVVLVLSIYLCMNFLIFLFIFFKLVKCTKTLVFYLAFFAFAFFAFLLIFEFWLFKKNF